MKQNTLIESLYKIGAVKFGEFTLKSGKTSKIYLDLRQIVSHPHVLRAVSDAIWEKVSASKFDLICGVPYTALPIATCVSLDHNVPMIMRRKEKKEYGTKQQIEGKYEAGQSCLIIEDVITSGASILETTAELEAAGLKVKDLAVLIDRQQGGKENLQAKNYAVHAVFTMQEIFKLLLQSPVLPPAEHQIVEVLAKEWV